MSTDGHGTKWCRKIAENFNRLSRVHQRYRRQTADIRQTDGKAIAYHRLRSLKTDLLLTRAILSTLEVNVAQSQSLLGAFQTVPS